MPRILVIDDDSLLRTALRATLEKCGHEVMQAENGRKAVRRMQEEDWKPALVITDMVMPEMDGLEVIHHFRRFHPEIPLVAVSGEMPENFLHLAKRLGAQETLTKPLDLFRVRETVDQLLTACPA